MSTIIHLHRRQRLDTQPIPWPALEQSQQQADNHRLMAITQNRSRRPHLECRVRLCDEQDGAIEFSIFGHRSLRYGCQRALEAWSLFYPRHIEVQAKIDEALAAHAAREEAISTDYQARCYLLWKECGLSKREMFDAWTEHIARVHARSSVYGLGHQLLLLSLPSRLSIQVAPAGQPADWRQPWNDFPPVWLTVLEGAADHVQEGRVPEWRLGLQRLSQPHEHAAEVSWMLLWMGIREAMAEHMNVAPTSP